MRLTRNDTHAVSEVPEETDVETFSERLCLSLTSNNKSPNLSKSRPYFVPGNNLYVYFVHSCHAAYAGKREFFHDGKPLPISNEKLDLEKVAGDLCESSTFFHIFRERTVEMVKKRK